MIGLKEAKRIVDGILDMARVNDMRIKMGLDHNKASLHMIFTGNPGSAKTTVARQGKEVYSKYIVNINAEGCPVHCLTNRMIK